MKFTAVLLSLLAVILLCSWVTAQNETGNPQRGAMLYEQHCLRCHGSTGDGNGPDSRFLVVPPANFQSDESRLKPDWEMLDIINYGMIFSPMHGWRDQLTDEEMLDVLSYIRRLSLLGNTI